MMHRFFKAIAAEAGFTMVERNVSAYSLSKFASAWDAWSRETQLCSTAGVGRSPAQRAPIGSGSMCF